MKRGSLIVVGTGISLAAHCSKEALGWIKAADIVFSVTGDPIAQCWLESLNPQTFSLHYLYKTSPDRPAAYAAMTRAILTAVREGKTVCAVFYGHPGVFVSPSHAAIEQARAEGFQAVMAPAISAEDCLIADLGVDPGACGWQSFEAHDFFFHARIFDPTAALILWQIAVVGDETLTAFEARPEWLDALALALMEHYPGGHLVTVYQAPCLPVAKPKIEQLALRELGEASVMQASTLYVPPFGAPQRARGRRALLEKCATERRRRRVGMVSTELGGLRPAARRPENATG